MEEKKATNFDDELKIYSARLDKLYKEIKPIQSSVERFEIPKCEGHVEGNKTIISNFIHIASILRRKPDHFAKFLLRELASPGQIEGDRLILQRKLNSVRINEKIKAYAQEFVICPQCGKPDTELIKDKDFLFLHCLACGAKHSVRAKIV